EISSTNYQGAVDHGGCSVAVDVYGQSDWRITASCGQRVRPGTTHRVCTCAAPARAGRCGWNQAEGQIIVYSHQTRGGGVSSVANGDGVDPWLPYAEVAGMRFGDGENGSIDVGN